MSSSTNLADPLTATLVQIERDTQVKARATRSAQIIRAFQQGCERARQVLAEHHQQSHP